MAVIKSISLLASIRSEAANNGIPSPQSQNSPSAMPLLSLSKPSWVVRTEVSCLVNPIINLSQISCFFPSVLGLDLFCFGLVLILSELKIKWLWIELEHAIEIRDLENWNQK